MTENPHAYDIHLYNKNNLNIWQCFTIVLHRPNTIFVNLLYISLLHETPETPNGSLSETGGISAKYAGTAYIKEKELKSEKIEKFR